MSFVAFRGAAAWASMFACLAAFSFAVSSCGESDHHGQDAATPSRDATVCRPENSDCTTAAECCSLLCISGQCADPTPLSSFGLCPTSPPAQGDPCSTNGVACEFGDRPVVACDEVDTC